MTIEICSNSLTSAMNAQKAGAHRVELCSELSLGGITPSAGMIEMVRKNLSIDVFVLIRPRAGDFCYSDDEMKIMERNIEFCKKTGCDGVVIGILKKDGTIDKTRTKRLIDLAQPMQVTFHRAFDVCKHPLEALEIIIELGCNRILTSGQHPTAIEGIDFLKRLHEQANDRISIMAGSGVGAKNVLQFKEMGLKEVHFSAKSLVESSMEFEHPIVQMETIPYLNWESDIENIKKVLDLI